MAITTHPIREQVRDRQRARPAIPRPPLTREQARRELGFDLIRAERGAARR